eukprot:TRINITY_DN2387_c0_g1_i1.p1 TRINITY_DN2387_c0_g1~~TRINITY_DN2387_c0_g1_i1.p1  ORF type:complete len:283 (-),score=74.74 TRINITY_DN2387_c0_g1_i1:489-1337(-)
MASEAEAMMAQMFNFLPTQQDINAQMKAPSPEKEIDEPKEVKYITKEKTKTNQKTKRQLEAGFTKAELEMMQIRKERKRIENSRRNRSQSPPRRERRSSFSRSPPRQPRTNHHHAGYEEKSRKHRRGRHRRRKHKRSRSVDKRQRSSSVDQFGRVLPAYAENPHGIIQRDLMPKEIKGRDSPSPSPRRDYSPKDGEMRSLSRKHSSSSRANSVTSRSRSRSRERTRSPSPFYWTHDKYDDHVQKEYPVMAGELPDDLKYQPSWKSRAGGVFIPLRSRSRSPV